MTTRMSATEFARRAEALAHAKRLALAIDGITGVDFGTAYKGGRRTRKLAIRFHVAAKFHPAAVTQSQLLPKKILGYPCDVIQAKYSPQADQAPNPHSEFDPIRPGISVGNVQRTTTGTLGAIVRDIRSGGGACMLSNWHVLCASTKCAPGEPISQPGPFDSGANAARVVGKLIRWANLSHGYDCAIGSIDNAVHSMPEPLSISINLARVAEPALHMKVVKSGISSGVTHAVVDGLHGSYKMDYTAFGDTVRFMDGIHLVADQDYLDQDISLDGDSGSVWIDASTSSAVALHFAGEEGLGPLADYAVAHPLSRVFEILNITL